MKSSPAKLTILPLLSSFLILIACSTLQRAETIPPNTPVVQLPAVAETTEPTPLPPTPTPVQFVATIVDDRTGEPLSSATIFIDHASGSLSKAETITTDELGYFQIQNAITPLTMRVEAPGYEIWENTFDSAAALQNPANAQINLTPQITRGTVLDADTNLPLAGVTLTIDSADQQSVTTDDTGKFEFYSLKPDDIITIQPPEGYLPAEINPADNPNLDITLQPRQVTVTLIDSFTRSPLNQGVVSFNQTLTATTNISGEVTLLRVPVEGQLIAGNPGYVTQTVAYKASENVEITLPPLGLQGVVKGGDTGQPLAQAAIYLGDMFFRTDDNGFFALDTLPITPTQLMIKAAGYHRTYARISQTGVITGFDPAPFSGVEGRWLTVAACGQSPQPTGLPCFEFTLEPFQAKAIYVPLHYLRSRERMLGYLDFIAATELNAIVVDVKGDFGFIAWDSDVDLVSEIGADEWFSDTWMPLDEFIAEAKSRNIYTIARMVVFKDNPLANAKPEWAAVREDGTVWLDGEELGWANPFREETWDYNIELAKEVADFGFDELNFDYIRFPSDGDVNAIVYEEENTLETRTTAIREFMTRLSESLRPTGVFVSADVFGLTLWVVPDSDMHIGQRVIDVAPQIDYLAPMVYPSTFGPGNLGYDNPSTEPYNVVYRSQEQAETIVPPYVKVRPWLQGYWYSLDEMQLLKQAALDSDSTGWSWWNAGGKYDSDLFEAAEDVE